MPIYTSEWRALGINWHHRTKRVTCVETGQQWDSQAEAAEELGISASYLGNKIRFGEDYKGRHYTSELCYPTGRPTGIRPSEASRGRSVICRETGQKWRSILSCTKDIGIPRSILIRKMNRDIPINGLHYDRGPKTDNLKIKCEGPGIAMEDEL